MSRIERAIEKIFKDPDFVNEQGPYTEEVIRVVKEAEKHIQHHNSKFIMRIIPRGTIRYDIMCDTSGGSGNYLFSLEQIEEKWVLTHYNEQERVNIHSVKDIEGMILNIFSSKRNARLLRAFI